MKLGQAIYEKQQAAGGEDAGPAAEASRPKRRRPTKKSSTPNFPEVDEDKKA